MDDVTFLIGASMRNNYLGLFEELLSMKNDDQAVLFAWFMNNLWLIEQSDFELKSLQSEEEIRELEKRMPHCSCGDTPCTCPF